MKDFHEIYQEAQATSKRLQQTLSNLGIHFPIELQPVAIKPLDQVLPTLGGVKIIFENGNKASLTCYDVGFVFDALWKIKCHQKQWSNFTEYVMSASRDNEFNEILDLKDDR